MQRAFEARQEFQQGQAGETAIARWLRSRGRYVLPVYEKIIDDGKGPRLYAPNGRLVAPDLVVMSELGMTWVEAKHKSGWTWHRKTGRYTTGIDIRHYAHYLQVADGLGYPLWLMFLQAGEPTKDSPENATPAGLYGGDIQKLRHCENHRSDKWGSSGMVYWSIDALTFLANYNDVVNA